MDSLLTSLGASAGGVNAGVALRTECARALANMWCHAGARAPHGSAATAAQTLCQSWAADGDVGLQCEARRVRRNLSAVLSAAAVGGTTPPPLGAVPRIVYGDMIIPLYDDSDTSGTPDVDIVLVHGMHGSPISTWRHAGAPRITGRASDYWPAAWLAPDLAAAGVLARVMSIRFESSLFSHTSRHGHRPLSATAAHCTTQLRAAGVGSRPVVWIAHSMGGLLTKQIVVDGGMRTTAGALFYSTPHGGSPMARHGKFVSWLVTPSAQVEDLRIDNPKLRALDDSFCRLARELGARVHCVGESRPTPLEIGSISAMIVPSAVAACRCDSTELEVLPQTDHIDVCKPANKGDRRYKVALELVLDSVGQRARASGAAPKVLK